LKWPLLVLPQLLLQLLLAPLIAAPAPGALLQLSGAPLRGGRLRGSFNLPFERASGADTPVLAFTAAGQPEQPLRLLLDPGTTLTLLLPAAARLGLRPQAQGAAALTLADGGLGCGELRPRRVKLPPLCLAGPNSRDGLLRLEGAEALVLPVAALPQGVLGIASLRQLPFASDPRASRLRFGISATQASEGAAAAAISLPLRWRRGLPLLDLQGPRGPRRDGDLHTQPDLQAAWVRAILGQELLSRYRQLWRLDLPSPQLELR
jgi:hypothetical protein